MHSEIYIAEVNRAIQQKLKTAQDKDPRFSFQAIWDRVRKAHGSFKPSSPCQHQFSLAENMPFRVKLPKRVESTKEKRIPCMGGFFNPL
jgi:hypothetical protein